MANNPAKLSALDYERSEVEKQLAREHRKMTETDDAEIQQEIRDRIRGLEGELLTSNLKSRRGSKPSLRTEQLSGRRWTVRETFRRLLHEVTTLAERIRPFFGSKGLPLHRFSRRSACTHWCLGKCAHTAPAPKPSDKGGVADWVKRHLRAHGRALANLAGKFAAALPGDIGSLLSWLLGALSRTGLGRGESCFAWLLGPG